MKSTHYPFLLLFITPFFLLLQGSQMKHEADKFLHSMPAGLQEKQRSAIIEAIGGDNTALQAVRNSRNTKQPLPDNVEARYVATNMRLYSPKDTKDAGKPLPLLVYLHGGGWVLGSINSCARFCGELAATGKAIVLAVDYRLAPEHPFPTGLDDCAAALDFAIANAAELGSSPDLVSIGGDSSGGNLAIATALRHTAAGKPLRSLLLFYPVIYAYPDDSESWSDYGKGCALNSDLMEAFNKAYIGGNDMRDPQISVGLADGNALSLLPRTLLVAAQRDILCDQGKYFIEKLNDAGVDAKRTELRGSVHLFITVTGQERAFRKSVKLTTDFLSAN